MASRKKKEQDAPQLEPISLDTGKIQPVRIGELGVSPFNVRKDATADDDLIASISSHGLLQPLVGYIAKEGPHLILICAGQRRLLALRKLVETGRLMADATVPVRQVDEDTAIEISLAENLERKSMGPVDEFRAFQALIDTGRYNEQLIADRFGYSRRQVIERLRLANLHPEVMTALEKGQFGIEAAKCFCVVNDPEAQLAVFKQAQRAQYDKFKPSSILTIVNSAGLSADTPAGRFIGGKKAYEKAGGTFEVSPMDDLFAKHSYSGKRVEAMKDAAVVKQLWDTAWSKAEPALRKDTAEQFGFEVGSVLGIVHNPSPMKDGGAKAPAETFKFKTTGYDYTGYGHSGEVTKKFFDHAMKKFAKEGARIHGITSLSHDGKPLINSREVYVSNDMKDVLEKLKQANQTKLDKEREAQAAERSRGPIERAALYLYWSTLTVEEKIDGMVFSRVWRQNSNEPDGGHFNCEFNRDVPWSLVEPFVAQAEAEAEAKAKAEELRQQQEAEAEKAAIEAFNTAYNAIREGEVKPEVIVFSDGDTLLIDARKVDGDQWLVEYHGTEDDDETLELDVFMDIVASYADAEQVSLPKLTTYDSFGDYEAVVMGQNAPAPDNDETPQPEPQLEAAE